MLGKRTVAFAIAGIMTLTLAACGNQTATSIDDSDLTTTVQDEPLTTEPLPTAPAPSNPAPAKAKFQITPTTAQSLQTEPYQTADFSMTIPKGWRVTTGGTNIFHSIRVSDPNEPLNQMFILLKADLLLHSQAGKAAWQQNYQMGNSQAAIFSQAPVLENPSTESLFRVFPQYASFVSTVESSYSGYVFPQFADFSVVERFPSNSSLAASAIGDELLRATFTDNGKAGEGMFTASVVDFGSIPVATGNVSNYQLQTVDGGWYSAYNIMAITAAKDTFIDWEGLLTNCMKTLQYSSSFVNAANQASDAAAAQATQISQNFNEAMDGMMSSWQQRDKSQDIMSQKQSDATLGYERVYDTDSGKIYKTTNGFTDVYTGNRFKPVTDDNMYAEPVSGYIEKMD